MPIIARGQVAAEDSLARAADRLLFCDTDPLATVLWSEALFAEVDPAVTLASEGRRYDLTLLLDADVPYVDDPVRYLPSGRARFFERCVDALAAAGRPYVVLRGDWEERWRRACVAVDALIRGRGHEPPAPTPLQPAV
jgi:NadR type nicotinamide-nucleotide adenylyltransferase